MNLNFNLKREITSFLFSVIVSGFCFSMGNPVNELKKTFTENFDVTEFSIVDIEHKDGNIEVYHSEGSVGRVEVNLIIRGDVKEDLQYILDKYELSIQSRGNTFKINSDTNIKSRYIITRGWLFPRTKSGIEFESGKEINSPVDDIICQMKIYLPKVKLVKLENRHNDIYIDRINSDVDLTLYDGELESQNISGSLKIDLKHSSASLQDFEDGDFQLYDSTIEAMNVGHLELEAKHSDIKFNIPKSIKGYLYDSELEFFELKGKCDIEAKHSRIETTELSNGNWILYDSKIKLDRVDSLTLESKHGVFDIDLCDQLILNNSYDNTIKIENVQKLTSTNSRHSRVYVDELHHSSKMVDCYDTEFVVKDLIESFESIEFEGRNSTFEIDFHSIIPAHSVSVSLRHGEFDFNENKYDLSKYVDKDSQLEIEASYKNPNPASQTINIEGTSIDARINF